MTWVQVHPLLASWPADPAAMPPVFEISADINGTAVLELAYDPQALLAPARYGDGLRYVSTDRSETARVATANGSSRAVTVAATPITLIENRAEWTMPAELWRAYCDDFVHSRGATRWSGHLYYRVRLTPVGASSAVVWPESQAVRNRRLEAPHISLLPVCAEPYSQVLPDRAAIAAMGGLTFWPSMWGDLLTHAWNNLPPGNDDRKSLSVIFDHPAYRAAPLASRSALLTLWLFATSDTRKLLPRLLRRQAVVGSNLTIPLIEKTAAGRSLPEHLLAFFSVTPHPDLVNVTTKAELVRDVLTEILDPGGQINQGEAGTCAPTSIQTLLLTVNPAEYARLQLGWLSKAGAATLADGSVADVPNGIYQGWRYVKVDGAQPPRDRNAGFHFRTYAELAFQAAILKHAQGARFTTGTVQEVFEHVINGGLQSTESERALESIFKVSFSTREAWPPTSPGFAAAQQSVLDGFLADLDAMGQPLVLATFWSKPPLPPPADGVWPAHAVLAIKRENGRVFYKNPQYRAPNPPVAPGGLAANPPRRYEDTSEALESISEADLANWILAYHVHAAGLI